jgi:hypothetical protein
MNYTYHFLLFKGEPRLKVHHSVPLAEANLRPRVSPFFSLKPAAFFSCERGRERTLRVRSHPPTNVTTSRVTDAPFPLHVRKMRAHSAVRYVR